MYYAHQTFGGNIPRALFLACPVILLSSLSFFSVFSVHSRRVSRFKNLLARLLPLDEIEIPELDRILEENKSQGQIWLEIPDPGPCLREKLQLKAADVRNGIVVRAVRRGAPLNQYLSFLLEAEALAGQKQLENPLILQHLGIFKGESDSVYIFYPKTEGSLALYAEKKPSLIDIAKSAAQMALAVDELTKKGLVHRSVSLKDFVFDAKGRLRLSNFTFLSQVNNRVDPDAQALWSLRKLIGPSMSSIQDSNTKSSTEGHQAMKVVQPDKEGSHLMTGGKAKTAGSQLGGDSLAQAESGDSRLVSVVPFLGPVCCPVVTEETDAFALGLAFRELADSLQQAVNKEQSMIRDLLEAGRLHRQRESTIMGDRTTRGSDAALRDRLTSLEKQAVETEKLAALSRRMTQADAAARPTLAEVLKDDLFAGLNMKALRQGKDGRALLTARGDGWFPFIVDYLSDTKTSLWKRFKKQ